MMGMLYDSYQEIFFGRDILPLEYSSLGHDVAYQNEHIVL